MKLYLRQIIILICLCLLPISTVFTKEKELVAIKEDKSLIRIGVLAFRGKKEALQRWSATAQYLSKKILTYQFEIIPLNLTEMYQGVKEKQLHFALTNPGNYVELESHFGISRIATLQTQRKGQLSSSFGSLIIARADNPQIKTLSDLKGKTFMAVSVDAFGGFQLAWRELVEQGIDPFNDFSTLQFVGFPQDSIVYAIRDKKVDAGTVRVEILLRLIDESKVNFKAFRILNQQIGSNHSYPLSTRRYPEWPFSRLKDTSYELSTEVALALYAMPADHYAAQVSRTVGWTIPLDYSAVYELMRVLQIGPYEVLRQTSLPALVKKYALWLFAGILILAFLIILNLYVSRTNHKLRKISAVLRDEIRQRERSQIALAKYKDTLQEKVLERTNELKQTNLSLRISQVALKKLADITMTPLLTHDEKLMKLLETGREYYHLPIAVLSSVDGKKNTMCKVSGTLECVTKPFFPLNKKCANEVIEQMGEPVDIPHLLSSQLDVETKKEISDSQCCLKNYLAAAILVNGKVHCIMEFGGIEPRLKSYSHWDYNILKLMAQWIGSELERKYADEEKQQHQNELARVSRLTAMGEMAASLAHELNQPLTGAINYSSGCIRMLKEGSFDNKKLLLGLQRSVEGITLAADIIRQLREFVQKGESKRTAIDVNKAILNVIDLIKPELHTHKVKIKLELSKPIDTVLANIIQIEQVILNFIRNAIDAMENIKSSNRVIVVSTLQEQENVILTVKDSGEGIDKNKLNAVFDAFYSSKADGMGMGLSISRSIIEANNGRISAVNMSQGGSLFKFELPVFKK